MQTAYLLVASVSVLFAIRIFVDFRQKLKSIGHLPGHRVLFAPSTVIGNVLPRLPSLFVGHTDLWNRHYDDFKKFGSNAYSAVSIWPRNPISIYVADAEAIKEIAQSRNHWPKPIGQYGMMQFFGDNIIATEGDEWKRHRKIAAPAFVESNNRLVFEETIRIVTELFDIVWNDPEELVAENFLEIAYPITLLVLGSAAFGKRISWKEDATIPSGYNLTFKDSLQIVSKSMFTKFLFPEWTMGQSKRLRTVKNAFYDLKRYMHSMIHERRSGEKKVERFDLLSLLLSGSEEETNGAAKLSDSDLVGNVFIFLLAGHETTAHTISLALAHMALFPDEQEILYNHIQTVLPGGKLSTYADVHALTQTLNVIYETLRLFPAVSVPKESAEDSSITVTDSNGARKTVFVPKGAQIVLHTPGLHYNPNYWKDPNDFKPQRFNEDWPRDAFLPFSGGARSCLGRRFAEVEAIVVLTMIISRFKIEIKEEPQYAAETFEQRKKRILRVKPGITMTPIGIPLVFKKRVILSL